MEIARPPEEVFAFVADALNDARWTPQIEAVRTVEAVPAGARFTISAEMRTGGFFWLLPDPFFGALLRQQGKQTLDNLKALIPEIRS